MKKLLVLISMAFLLGCEVKDKMVIQYGDYEETVLIERVESELGFEMDVIYGVEYREDLDAKTFELLEPYSLSITVRDDVEEIYDLYTELRFTNITRDPNVGRPNEHEIFHPDSARLPYFDMFIIGEGTEDAIFYLIKEAEDLHYIVQFTIPTVNQAERFSEIRSMLATFKIPGYESEARYYLREDIHIDRFRGVPENVTINHFRYYEEEKELSNYEADLPSIIGDPAKPYVDDSELYKENIWELINGAPPTGNLLRNQYEIIDLSEGLIFILDDGKDNSDNALRINFFI